MIKRTLRNRLQIIFQKENDSSQAREVFILQNAQVKNFSYLNRFWVRISLSIIGIVFVITLSLTKNPATPAE